jgi:hypothetical protein
MHRNNLIKSVKFLVLAIVLISGTYAAELKLLNEKPDGLTIKFTTQSDIKIEGLESYPQEPVRIRFIGQNIQNFSRDLLLPVESNMLALPDTTKPELEITGTTYEKYDLPGTLPRKIINELQGIKPVTITNPGYSRFVPATILKIIPLEYDQNNDRLLIIRSMTIRINFRNKGQKNNSRTKPKTISHTGFLNKKYIDRYYQPKQRELKKETSYPSGKWLRIGVEQTAIYKLSFNAVSEKLNLDEGIDKNRIALFSNSNSGRKLSSQLNADVPQNLVPNSIKFSENNNNFNAGDTIHFYGQATSGFELNEYGNYSYNKNPYSDINYYWLLIADQELSSPKRMDELSPGNQQADYEQNTTEIRYRFENDIYNYMQSGTEWFGKKFAKKGDSKTVVLSLNNINLSMNNFLNTDRRVNADIRLAGGKNNSNNYFEIYFNNQLIKNANISNFYRRAYNISNSDIENYIDINGSNYFKISYETSNSEAYFDYLEMRYHRDLIYDNQPFILTGDKYTGIIKYELANEAASELRIYDITSPTSVALQGYNLNGENIEFISSNNKHSRQRYYICSSDDYREPVSINYIEDCEWDRFRNNNLNADYIIITDEKFQQAAEKIAAVHEERVPAKDRLKTVIATQDQILREFNGDVRDPNAIRYFIKYAFENWQAAPGYVLLLGDGTYDYRGIEQQFAANNYIMTYQDYGYGNLGEYYYFPNDGYYGYINGNDRIMDVAIGRLPARTLEQAMAMAEKIEKYILNPEYGDWRNHVTLVADDPNRPGTNEKQHINDSENRLAKNFPLFFNLSKLYALEFPAEENASSYGVGRPQATEAIIEHLNQGTGLITYLGHGSPDHWAQEGLLETNDLGKINTGLKLPIWLVGTCSWSYYDFLDRFCIPERLIIKENSSAIATFGGPRPSYATNNASLLTRLLREWFSDNKINRIRIGELIRRVKFDDDDEQYTLLGDPALFPALPYYKADFNELNNDTLKSLEQVKVKGIIEDELSGFSGEGIIKVFDSREKVEREDTEGNTLDYTLPGNKIYKGKIEIRNGSFTTNFIVPKDISFGSLPGNFNIYAWNSETGAEVSGYYDNIYYRGSKNISDSTGPRIEIGFTELDFRENDIVTPDNQLVIKLADKNGINITNQLGHELTLKFNDSQQVYNVTDNFTSTSDTAGEIIYSLPENLEPGLHRVTIQAWDNANNINMQTSQFNLVGSGELKIKRVVNYPNPFAGSTDFTFHLTREAKIKIKIYTIRGLLIKEINPEQLYSLGFNKIHWNGKDDYGDPISRGIYLYKISAKSETFDEKDSYIGKMVKE